MVRKPSDLVNRRNVLKSIGAIGAASSVPLVGSARSSNFEDFKAVVERAIEIRDRAGFRAYEKFLRAKGLGVRKVRGSYPTGSKSGSGGVSTEKIDNVDTEGIDITMSLVYDRYQPSYYTELYFRYLLRIGYSPQSLTEAPKDSIGFSWFDACWEPYSYNLDETSYSSEHVQFEDDAFGASTFGFQVDDRSIGADTSCTYPCETYSDYYFDGVYLTSEKDTNGECDTTSDTKILGVYDHTWEGTYSSFSVSAAWPASIGISYTTDTYVEHERTTTEDDGETGLVVTL